MKRRDFLTLSIRSAMAAGLTASIPMDLLYAHTLQAASLAAGLSDPAMQPLFMNPAPNALDPGFKYVPNNGRLRIRMARTVQMTGLVGMDGYTPVPTSVWGYGAHNGPVSWPGRTIEIAARQEPLEISWENELIVGAQADPHLLPVDTSLHWAYSLSGYSPYSLAEEGVPVVTHVHGGRNDSPFDGNPEYFFSPRFRVLGPRWESRYYRYGGPDWNEAAGTCWYHDHALGVTRLNVYAGLAGFFIVRDEADTGLQDNALGLPAAPYELGFAVQDRMFRHTGELFYPAYPGDPLYSEFIDEEGVELPEELFPDGGPTALAEFFGDHMVVNGVIWPQYDVEQRQYRVRLLNGCDSRFMRLRLKMVPAGETDPGVGEAIAFHVIGSDQSLREQPVEVDEVGFAPGERLDLVVDFKRVPMGYRVIIENLLGDAPFGGELPKKDDFFPNRRTDRILAFDVVLPLSPQQDTDISEASVLGGGVAVPDPLPPAEPKVRRLALFEGTDEFGRLQPLLGTAEPVLDVDGHEVQGALAWHSPITENPQLDSTEIWELYNATGDAHPIHVHLVYFQILDRQSFKADLIEQPVLQHNGEEGRGYRLENIKLQGQPRPPEPQEQTRRDIVTALPGQVTRIKMRFDKPGRFVWHCHILSHEDHEMMRPFHVGPGPF